MKPMVHVVDDDESLRTALLRLLKGSGFEAIGYGSTGEFLLHHPPDRHGCILLDIICLAAPRGSS
jgi:FixJ family two-component response regulator